MKKEVHVRSVRRSGSLGRFALLFLFGTAISPFLGNQAVAQSSGPTYPMEQTMWTGLEESATMVDVSYRVMKCDASAPSQVMLQVFNEGGLVSAIGFTLTIEDNASEASFSHTVSSFPVSVGSIVTGQCGSTSNLIIDLPAGYDGSNLHVDINYN